MWTIPKVTVNPKKVADELLQRTTGQHPQVSSRDVPQIQKGKDIPHELRKLIQKIAELHTEKSLHTKNVVIYNWQGKAKLVGHYPPHEEINKEISCLGKQAVEKFGGLVLR